MPADAPTWRPGSDQILFRGGRPDMGGDLYVVGSDGTGLTKLTLSKAGIGGSDDFGHGFNWSPDGKQIAYELVDSLDLAKTGVDSGLRIHVAEIGPSGAVLSEHRLEFDPQADNELQPVWLPSGNQMVFQTRDGFDDYLSVAPAPTGSSIGAGTAMRVGPASTAGGGIGFEVAPDGRSLLVLFRTEHKGWRYDLDTLQATLVDLGGLDVASYQRLAP